MSFLLQVVVQEVEESLEVRLELLDIVVAGALHPQRLDGV